MRFFLGKSDNYAFNVSLQHGNAMQLLCRIIVLKEKSEEKQIHQRAVFFLFLPIDTGESSDGRAGCIVWTWVAAPSVVALYVCLTGVCTPFFKEEVDLRDPLVIPLGCTFIAAKKER